MKRRYIYGIFTVLLFAAPLSAQDTIPLPREVIVINGDSIYIDVDVDVSTERLVEVFEAMQASLDSALVALRDCDRCDEEQTSTSATTEFVNVGKNVGIVLLAILGIRKLGQIADAINNHEHPDGEPKEEGEYGEGGDR